MCLVKDPKHHLFNRPLIAKEDIVCYKQLDKIRNTYITPCTSSRVPIECIQGKVPFKATILNKIKFIWKHVLGLSDVVTDGFIHSHVYVHDPSFLFVTFKCIIPKGTKYFIGIDRDYASEQIIFVERL